MAQAGRCIWRRRAGTARVVLAGLCTGRTRAGTDPVVLAGRCTADQRRDRAAQGLCTALRRRLPPGPLFSLL
eukprot:2927124-Rhodomonas_salina.1